MGGCSAAVAAGWPALCQVTQLAWQVQSVADRVVGGANAVAALGPLPLVLLLLMGLVGTALAWHVFLWLADIIFRSLPLVLVVGLVILYVTH